MPIKLTIGERSVELFGLPLDSFNILASSLAALAAIGSTYTAYKVFVESKRIRRSSWLFQQNQAWTSYNQAGMAPENQQYNRNVNGLCTGGKFNKNIVDSHKGRNFLFARMNILESDFFGYFNGYADIATLYYTIGSVKEIAQERKNFIYMMNFLLCSETYDPKFVNFYCILLLYFRFCVENEEGEGEEKKDLRAISLKRSQIKRLMHISSVYKTETMEWCRRMTKEYEKGDMHSVLGVSYNREVLKSLLKFSQMARVKHAAISLCKKVYLLVRRRGVAAWHEPDSRRSLGSLLEDDAQGAPSKDRSGGVE